MRSNLQHIGKGLIVLTYKEDCHIFSRFNLTKDLVLWAISLYWVVPAVHTFPSRYTLFLCSSWTNFFEFSIQFFPLSSPPIHTSIHFYPATQSLHWNCSYQGQQWPPYHHTQWTLFNPHVTCFRSIRPNWPLPSFFFFFVNFFIIVFCIHSILKFIYIVFYLFLAALGLRCCTQAFSSYGERGLLFVAASGLLIAVASLVTEHGL